MGTSKRNGLQASQYLVFHEDKISIALAASA